MFHYELRYTGIEILPMYLTIIIYYLTQYLYYSQIFIRL